LAGATPPVSPARQDRPEPAPRPEQGPAAGSRRPHRELASRRPRVAAVQRGGPADLAAFVASDAEGREQAKALISDDRLITVYVQASPQTCQQRDPQGLYAAGGDNIPGESFPYDVPLKADLMIDTETSTVEEGAKQVIQLLRERGAI